MSESTTIAAPFAGYTTRFAEYCAANGFTTPTEQKKADGNMTNYILWCSQRTPLAAA